MSTGPILSKIVVREDAQAWEQVVFAEVVIPNVPNTYGDVYTFEACKEFAYEFMRLGFAVDIDHDQVDVNGTHAYPVESFIARTGDPDFIEGAWVVGMKIVDPELWQSILDGDINGYSYQAFVSFLPIVFDILTPRTVTGVTAPYPVDGHTHGYTVILDGNNTVIAGGTTETDGHQHTISTHTITDEADGHVHRYQILTATDDLNEVLYA